MLRESDNRGSRAADPRGKGAGLPGAYRMRFAHSEDRRIRPAVRVHRPKGFTAVGEAKRRLDLRTNRAEVQAAEIFRPNRSIPDMDDGHDVVLEPVSPEHSA